MPPPPPPAAGGASGASPLAAALGSAASARAALESLRVAALDAIPDANASRSSEGAGASFAASSAAFADASLASALAAVAAVEALLRTAGRGAGAEGGGSGAAGAPAGLPVVQLSSRVITEEDQDAFPPSPRAFSFESEAHLPTVHPLTLHSRGAGSALDGAGGSGGGAAVGRSGDSIFAMRPLSPPTFTFEAEAKGAGEEAGKGSGEGAVSAAGASLASLSLRSQAAQKVEKDGTSGSAVSSGAVSSSAGSASAAASTSAPPVPAPPAFRLSPPRPRSSALPVSISEGASELQRRLDALPPSSVALVHWRASWVAPCLGLDRQIEALARSPGAASPFAASFVVDVESSPANRQLSLEKVLEVPASRRVGVRLVPRAGRRWPLVSVHLAPEMHPVAVASGEDCLVDAVRIAEDLGEAGEEDDAGEEEQEAAWGESRGGEDEETESREESDGGGAQEAADEAGGAAGTSAAVGTTESIGAARSEAPGEAGGAAARGGVDGSLASGGLAPGGVNGSLAPGGLAPGGLAGPPAPVETAPAASRAAASPALPPSPPRLTLKGAAAFRDALRSSQPGAPVLVLWLREGSDALEAALALPGWRRALAERPLALLPVGGPRSHNGALAHALKVREFPALHVYRGLNKLRVFAPGALVSGADLDALGVEPWAKQRRGGKGAPGIRVWGEQAKDRGEQEEKNEAEAKNEESKEQEGGKSKEESKEQGENKGESKGESKEQGENKGESKEESKGGSEGEGKGEDKGESKGSTEAEEEAPPGPGNPLPSSSSSIFACPDPRFARPGQTKSLPDGRLVHFFPKMPCLRCGCPWWTSDDWDGRCLRCGWDCETGGYDDDSQPLPKFKKRWEGFVESIKRGETPPYDKIKVKGIPGAGAGNA